MIAIGSARPFFGAAADYLLIGALWSIVLCGVMYWYPGLVHGIGRETLIALFLFINAAHFAASTVRLYNKRENFSKYPVLTLAFPAITFVVLGLCIVFPEVAGRQLQALYLTWSPYHYAMQAYGICVMYCFRSGCLLSDSEKRWLQLICLVPFLRSFLGSPSAGLGWFVSREAIGSVPGLSAALDVLTSALAILTFAGPLLLLVMTSRGGKKLPLICFSILFSNGLWWTVFDYFDAFVIATIAHSLQYLAIVIAYEIKERAPQGSPRDKALIGTVFYLKSLVLGYALFYCWPLAFVWAGAGVAESMLLVVATINLHHFIVDAFIWRSPRRNSALAHAPGSG